VHGLLAAFGAFRQLVTVHLSSTGARAPCCRALMHRLRVIEVTQSLLPGP